MKKVSNAIARPPALYTQPFRRGLVNQKQGTPVSGMEGPAIEARHGYCLKGHEGCLQGAKETAQAAQA